MRGDIDLSDPDKPFAEKDPANQLPYSVDFGARFAAWGRVVESVQWITEGTLTVLQEQLVAGKATALIGGGTLDEDLKATARATSNGTPPVVLDASLLLKIREF